MIKYWFCSGHCNLYGEILYRVFGELSRPYTNGVHIVTKIGDLYYDSYGGLINFIDYKPGEFIPYEDSKLICENSYKEDLLGNYDPETDDIIIKIGVQAGIECLNRIIAEIQAKLCDCNTVKTVIEAINERIALDKTVLTCIFEKNERRQEEVIEEVKGWFYGHSNIHAEILQRIFGELSRPYTKNDQVITRIGNNYYDTCGCYIYNSEEEPEDFSAYEDSNGERLPLIEGLIGNYDGSDDKKTIEAGVQAGMECLASIMNKKEHHHVKSIG